MWRLKSCPRCKGDVRIDWDYYGWYEQCVQCGYQRDMKGILEVPQKLRTDEDRANKV